MLIQIFTNTPKWVWVILAVLLWAGLTQTLPRSASLRRITLLPLAMVGLSVYGTLSALGSGLDVLLAWSSAALVSATVVLQRPLPPGTTFNTWTRRFELPGSWLPLCLMMGIFITKYAVGVALTMRPELRQAAVLTSGAAALYGAFSGVFMARSARLWQLAYSQANAGATPPGATT